MAQEKKITANQIAHNKTQKQKYKKAEVSRISNKEK